MRTLIFVLFIFGNLFAATIYKNIGTIVPEYKCRYVKSTCVQMYCGDNVYHAGVWSPDHIIFYNGNIYNVVNQKAMLITLTASGSLTVKDTKITNVKIDYNFTNGCRIHIDGMFVRGWSNGSFNLSNIKLTDLGGGVMPIIMENAGANVINFNNVVFDRVVHAFTWKVPAYKTIQQLNISYSNIPSWNMMWGTSAKILRANIKSSNVGSLVSNLCSHQTQVWVDGIKKCN